MPIIKSSIKQAKKSLERRDRRLPYKTKMKTMIRKVSDFAKAGKLDDAAKTLSEAYKAIDTAAKKNIIHKKNAARKKSMLAKMVSTKKK